MPPSAVSPHRYRHQQAADDAPVIRHSLPQSANLLHRERAVLGGASGSLRPVQANDGAKIAVPDARALVYVWFVARTQPRKDMPETSCDRFATFPGWTAWYFSSL
jgi:hypothetical protein